jgi:hypothetical protein
MGSHDDPRGLFRIPWRCFRGACRARGLGLVADYDPGGGASASMVNEAP